MTRVMLCLMAVCLPTTSALAADPRCGDAPVTYEEIGPLIDTEDKARQLASIYLAAIPDLAQNLLLNAEMSDGVWIVRAKPPRRSGFVQLGGNAEVELCKSNGRVLRLVAGR